MSAGDSSNEFWAALPKKVRHPCRTPILEAFRWIGEPLSAVSLVGLCADREIARWEAAYHLRVLEALGAIEPCPYASDTGAERRDGFDLPYRLASREVGRRSS